MVSEGMYRDLAGSVFYARRDIFRHLVRTRLGFGYLLPRLPPFELPLWIFFVEGNVQSLLQDLRHMLLSILHTHDFGQSLELSL